MKDFPKTLEEQLAAARKGPKQDLFLTLGDLEIPCRILGHREEAATIANAKMAARKSKPETGQAQLFESMEVMRAILMKVTNVKSVQHLTPLFLNELSSAELDSLYDQYLTLMNTANPEFEKMSSAKIGEMIAAVKKKEMAPRDFFTWQLAAIGRCYLEEILLEANAPGRSS